MEPNLRQKLHHLKYQPSVFKFLKELTLDQDEIIKVQRPS